MAKHSIDSLADVTKALREALAEGKRGEDAVCATQAKLTDQATGRKK